MVVLTFALVLVVSLLPGQVSGLPVRHVVDSRGKTSRVAAGQPGVERWIASFSGPGNAYSGQLLSVRDRVTGRSQLVGQADPYVRPVWSLDSRELLYVRVRQVKSWPGARWTLLRYDRVRDKSTALVSANGMNMAPLGWAHGVLLFTLARATDTGIYRLVKGRAQYIAYLFTEPLTEPSLSPDGDHIAFVTPADCYWCTIAIYDMNALNSWFGPVGIPNGQTVAWTRNGGTLVTIVKHDLAAIDVRSDSIRLYTYPVGLPLVWTHPISAIVSPHSLQLTDMLIGRVYHAAPR